MKKYSININYPVEEMEKSRKRMAARQDFKYYDRPPVNFTLVPRYFTKVFGMDYCEIFSDAEAQYRFLLETAKYQIENIPCDMCTEPVVYVHPYFDNVILSSAFGAEIVWPKNETLHALPVLKDPSEMEKYKIPEPDAGLCGKAIGWWLKMKEMAEDTEVIFGDVKGRAEVSRLSLMGLGPHMIAVDLAGTDFYWWVIEYPDECADFLEKITKGLILIEEHTRKVDPGCRKGFGVAEDTAQAMSDELFRKFAVPYDMMLFERFAKDPKEGRGMHMCGDSTHLLKTLVDVLEINSFNGFGYRVAPETAAAYMGGKVLLWGNIDPMLIHTGTKEEINKACLHALEMLAPFGGFMLGDGANICPGTPLENLAVLAEASEEYSGMHPEYFEE